MSEIKIGKLEIEKNDIGNCILKAKITLNSRGGVKDFILRFRYNVEDKYIETEFADSFLVAILPYAMEFGYDSIETEDYISSELFYNLTQNVVPVLSKNEKYFNYVNITSKKGIVEYKNGSKPKAIATGCSCGVDSLYTILTNINSKDNCIPEDLNLTDLVIINSGACSWKGGEESKKWFDIEVNRAKQVADELKLGLITINTNLMEFYGVSHEHSNFMRMIGSLLGIRKLIKRYYFASGYELKLFSFGNDDGTYQYFLTNELSNEDNKFITSGLCNNRYDKVKFISNYDVAKKHLNVCWTGGNNCGVCEKCLRTLGALDALNALDKYSNVFNIERYKNKRTKNIGLMLFNKKLHPEDYTFLKDIKKNDKKLYLKANLYCIFIIRPFAIAKSICKKLIKKDSWLYRKLKDNKQSI